MEKRQKYSLILTHLLKWFEKGIIVHPSFIRLLKLNVHSVRACYHTVIIETRFKKWRILDISDGLAHKLPSCQEEPTAAEFIRRLSHSRPLTRGKPFYHHQILPFYCERAVVSVRILKFVGSRGSKGLQKIFEFKGRPLSGRHPCVHSICRRLRDLPL